MFLSLDDQSHKGQISVAGVVQTVAAAVLAEGHVARLHRIGLVVIVVHALAREQNQAVRAMVGLPPEEEKDDNDCEDSFNDV